MSKVVLENGINLDTGLMINKNTIKYRSSLVKIVNIKVSYTL